MAEIKRYPWVRHLRSESSSFVLHHRRGKPVRSGAGLAFWFRPLAASIAELPLDDRELTFLFQGRSADYQEVNAQGVVTYRVSDPEKLSGRIDFSLDLTTGTYLKQPFEKLSLLVTQLAQQFAWEYIASNDLRRLLVHGVREIRDRITQGLEADEGLQSMGIAIVTVRVSAVSPAPDMEKALQTPTREEIQQEADDATFQRRARAVEKERAIQENELQNKIELAKREAELIAQEGQNQRRSATERSEAEKIAVVAGAEQRAIQSASEADALRLVETARSEGEKARMAIYRDFPASVLTALGLRELAGKLRKIEHLNLTPDMVFPLLSELVRSRKPTDSPREDGGPES